MLGKFLNQRDAIFSLLQVKQGANFTTDHFGREIGLCIQCIPAEIALLVAPFENGNIILRAHRFHFGCQERHGTQATYRCVLALHRTLSLHSQENVCITDALHQVLSPMFLWAASVLHSIGFHLLYEGVPICHVVFVDGYFCLSWHPGAHFSLVGCKVILIEGHGGEKGRIIVDHLKHHCVAVALTALLFHFIQLP